MKGQQSKLGKSQEVVRKINIPPFVLSMREGLGHIFSNRRSRLLARFITILTYIFFLFGLYCSILAKPFSRCSVFLPSKVIIFVLCLLIINTNIVNKNSVLAHLFQGLNIFFICSDYVFPCRLSRGFN